MCYLFRGCEVDKYDFSLAGTGKQVAYLDCAAKQVRDISNINRNALLRVLQCQVLH